MTPQSYVGLIVTTSKQRRRFFFRTAWNTLPSRGAHSTFAPMKRVTETNIKTLIPDDRNFNKGTEMGKRLIEESLRRFGAGRSILLDKNNRIIAGNKTIENAESVGLDNVLIVETDGRQIVAVKRTDIDLDSDKGRELALADNATNQANLLWDEEAIEKAAEAYHIDASEWCVTLDTSDIDPDSLSDDFTLKSGEKSPIQVMTFAFSDTQAEQIREAIALMKEEAPDGCAEYDGNANQNGNAIFLIAKQWADARRS